MEIQLYDVWTAIRYKIMYEHAPALYIIILLSFAVVLLILFFIINLQI
jgi:hypothetical protein